MDGWIKYILCKDKIYIIFIIFCTLGHTPQSAGQALKKVLLQDGVILSSSGNDTVESLRIRRKKKRYSIN